MLKEVKEKFDRIAEVSAKTSKMTLLRKFEDDELFLECLKFLLDTDVVTGLSTKKINKKVPIIENKYDSILDVFDYIKSHNTGTDGDITIVKSFCKAQGECEEFCIELFTKKLKVGIDVKTVNKVFGKGFIPTHEVMLASKFEGKLKEEVSISLKLDGIRNSAMIDGGIVHKSRQGKVVEGLNQINQALEELNLNGYFVDGELIRINDDNLSSDENFRLTTTIVNSKTESKEGLEFIVFDMTPIEDYYKGSCGLTYKERLELMEEKIGKGNKYVRLVPKFGTTKDVDVIYSKLEEVVSQNLEGLMLNTLNGKYEFGKRPKSILKVKKFQEGDVLVTDVIEGEGRLKGTLGAISCQFMYQGELCEVEIGSGFTDSDRATLYNNPSLILDKVITISFFEVSKNKTTNKYSLRFPTWKSMEYIRTDKQGIEDTNID